MLPSKRQRMWNPLLYLLRKINGKAIVINSAMEYDILSYLSISKYKANLIKYK